ncbi:chromosome partitioning protein ParB [Sorangium sp. So ce118]
MLLKIANIKATPEAQPRVSLHYPTVEEYTEALRGGAEFPPLVVFFDGSEHWLADGFHRIEAYRVCEYVEVPVDVRKGSKRDAILFSKGANARHGLPRTNADKRRAVESLLQDTEWGQKSDRWIAEAAAVGKTLVLRMREEMRSTGRGDQFAEREGKDGKTRKLPERQLEASGRGEVEASTEVETRGEAPGEQPSPQRSEAPKSAPRPGATIAEVLAGPDDPKRGCASLTERDSIEAWLREGDRIFGQSSEGGRDYMLNAWAKIVKRLEGYAA